MDIAWVLIFVLVVGLPIAWGHWMFHRPKRPEPYAPPPPDPRESQDFSWYRATYPDKVSPGRVTCIDCGGTRLHTERVMQGTYLRRHFCVNCGKTLYYSPEDI